MKRISLVYAAFAMEGAATAADAAEITGIKETTCYMLVQQLVKRGMLHKTGRTQRRRGKGRAPAFYSTLAP